MNTELTKYYIVLAGVLFGSIVLFYSLQWIQREQRVRDYCYKVGIQGGYWADQSLIQSNPVYQECITKMEAKK